MALPQGAPNLNNARVSPPSQPQVALALAIVKQKPANIDLKEHILQIRQFIKDARNSCRAAPRDDKYFDSVSFWQQAYEKSEAEQSKLLDQIYELEQRNAALVAKLNTGSSATAVVEDEKASNKRKVANRNAASRKRAKTQAIAGGDGFSSVSQIRSDNFLDGVEYLEGTTTSFMRQFYALQKTLQKRPNRSSVALAAVGLCKTAAEEVLHAVGQNQMKGSTSRSKQATTLLQMKQPGLLSVLHGVERAFRLLRQGLDKVTGAENTRDVGRVIYHLVCLFDAIMGALQQHCRARAEQNLIASTKSQKSKQPAKSKRAKTGRIAEAAPSASETDDEVAIQITRLLGTMSLSLELSRTEHKNLLEGFLFILLNRVGKLLCLFVFQDLRLRPDLQIDAAQLPLPKGLMETDLNETSLHAAQLESKHLIWLLERILAFLDAVPSSSPSPTQTQTELGEEFVSKIKERLQSTLLQAVFGTDDPLFQKKALQEPIHSDALELDNLRDCMQVPEQTVSDWFTQEVWRLLGWEMLTKVDIVKD